MPTAMSLDFTASTGDMRKPKICGLVNGAFSPDGSLDETFTDVPEACTGTYIQRVASMEEEFEECTSRADSPELELYVPCNAETDVFSAAAEPLSALPSAEESIVINEDSPMVNSTKLPFLKLISACILFSSIIGLFIRNR